MAAKVSRPDRPAPPALPPMEKLELTHQQITLMLRSLEVLMNHIEASGVSAAARSQARTICDFVARTARQHHLDEECKVFPLLLDKGNSTLAHHVRRLQQDHAWLEEDWLELGPQLESIAEGIGGVDLHSLRAGMDIYIALHRDHIALEESLVYPEAMRVLDAAIAARD